MRRPSRTPTRWASSRSWAATRRPTSPPNWPKSSNDCSRGSPEAWRSAPTASASPPAASLPYRVWLYDVHPREGGFHIERREPSLEGHNGLAFSPDGTSVATAGTDGKVIIWDAATDRQPIPLARPVDGDRAWAVAFRPPHGRQLAAGYSQKLVMIWDKDTRKERLLTSHTKDVYSVAYSPDGRWLASLDGYPGLIWVVAWSPDPERPLLAVAGGREGVGKIELWDTSDLPTRAAAERGR